MSGLKEKTWNFLLDIALWYASCLPVVFWLSDNTHIGISICFFLCYFTIFLMITFLLGLYDYAGLTIYILPVVPIAVLLIFRDYVLSINVLMAFFIFLLIYILYGAKLRKIGLILITIFHSVLWIPQKDCDKIIAISIIYLFIAVIVEWVSKSPKHWTVLVFIVSVIPFFIPVSVESIQWKYIKRAIAGAEKFFKTVVIEIDYFFDGLKKNGTAYAGYSDTLELTGGVSKNSHEELTLETKGRMDMIYLGGGAFSVIGPDGISGKEDNDLPYNAWFAMYLNALYHADVTKEEASCFSYATSANITYVYLRTSDLLVPATTFLMDRNISNGLSKPARKGFSYKLNYIAIDYASPYFIRVVTDERLSGKPENYSTMCEYAYLIYGIKLNDFMSEDDYYNSIESLSNVIDNPLYLDTSFATDRMLKLTDEITKNCENDFERAKAIEHFLRQYTYDQSVDYRGSNNYVDNFLFDRQRGYCVHFASAMVIMLRASGVPARYVHGYMHKNSDGKSVPGNEAHAWVEGYIEGIGWIPFEPTAAMENAELTTWGISVSEKTNSNENMDFSFDYKDEYMIPELPEKEDTVSRVVNENKKEKSEFIYILLLSIKYLLWILLAVVLLVITIVLVRYIHYFRLTPENKVKEDMQSLRHKIEKVYPETCGVESVFDYLPYLEDIQLAEKMRELFITYYRIRFRGDTPDEEFILKLHRAVKII